MMNGNGGEKRKEMVERLKMNGGEKMKETVEKLKEIVKSSSEDEIYNALIECDMNPHEAVVRLLSLDTFQKVKSKRERRKEIKEAHESRSRGSSISSNHNNVGCSGPNKFNPNESGKQEYIRENLSVTPMHASSSTSYSAGRIKNELPPTNSSDSENAEIRSQSIGISNAIAIAITAAAQPPPGFRSGCSGVPGQATMADVVRMGKPQNKTTSPPDNGWTEVVYSENPSSGLSVLDELPNISDDAMWQFCEPHEGVLGDSTFSYHSEPVDDNSVAALSIAENLQQLSLGKEKLETPHSEDNPELVIPSHLQVPPSEFSHLSFGTFRPTIDSSSLVSGGATDGSPVVYDAQRATFDTENCDLPSSSQTEMRFWDMIEAAQSHQYRPSSVYDIAFENLYQHFNSAQKRILHPYTNGMHTYSNPIPSDMLASNVQSISEPGHSYPSFARQLRYNSAVSSTNTPPLRMAEVLEECALSPAQLASHCLPRNNITSGHTCPDRLNVHPYPETALPLEQFSRMVGYEDYGSPHPTHSHMLPEAAYQQAYPSSSSLHQSAAAYAAMKHVRPQYRNRITVSDLAHSAATGVSYGIGGSTKAPVSFSQNGIGYDDTVLSSRLKENHFLPFLQNESSDMDGHGQSVREKALEEFLCGYRRKKKQQQQQQQQQQQEELLQLARFRQAQDQQLQQQQQQHGSLGYHNLYHS